MATRDIYETGFDEDVQTDSSGNQCPECDGHVSRKGKENVCEDCGLVIEEQRLNHGSEWRAHDEDEHERTGVTTFLKYLEREICFEVYLSRSSGRACRTTRGRHRWRGATNQ
jgi:transcription initiation factor TFIIB